MTKSELKEMRSVFKVLFVLFSQLLKGANSS